MLIEKNKYKAEFEEKIIKRAKSVSFAKDIFSLKDLVDSLPMKHRKDIYK